MARRRKLTLVTDSWLSEPSSYLLPQPLQDCGVTLPFPPAEVAARLEDLCIYVGIRDQITHYTDIVLNAYTTVLGAGETAMNEDRSNPDSSGAYNRH